MQTVVNVVNRVLHRDLTYRISVILDNAHSSKFKTDCSECKPPSAGALSKLCFVPVSIRQDAQNSEKTGSYLINDRDAATLTENSDWVNQMCLQC